MGERKRLYYIDVLRVIATIMVVCIHVSVWYMDRIGSTQFVIGYAINSVSRVCIGLFLMITGTLWLSRGIEISINSEKFFKISCKLFLMFILWNVLYSFRVHSKGFSFRFGGAYHLWYLVLASILYALIPSLAYLSDRLKVDVFLVCFMFGIALYSFGNLFNSSRSIDTILGEMLGYIGYVLVGYLLSKEKEYNRKKKVVFILIYLIMFSVRTVMGVWDSVEKVCISEKYFGYNFVGVFLESILVFLIVKNIKCKKQNKLIMFLSRYSFGIYLVHVAVVYVLEHFGIFKIIPMFLGIVLVLVVSSISSYILNKIPGVKWLVRLN